MESTKNREPDLPSISSSHAPWYHIPRKPVVSIEHPFDVQNIDKGTDSLGGLGRLLAVCRFPALVSHPDLSLVD